MTSSITNESGRVAATASTEAAAASVASIGNNGSGTVPVQPAINPKSADGLPDSMPDDERGLPKPRKQSIVAGIFVTKGAVYNVCVRSAAAHLNGAVKIVEGSKAKFDVRWSGRCCDIGGRDLISSLSIKGRVSRYLNKFGADRVVLCDSSKTTGLYPGKDLKALLNAVIDGVDKPCVLYPDCHLLGAFSRRISGPEEPSYKKAVIAAEDGFWWRGDVWVYLAEWTSLRRYHPQIRHALMKTPKPAALRSLPWYMSGKCPDYV